MDSLDSRKPLLTVDESDYSNTAFLLDTEDSSSGYDSTDFSDTESVSSMSSRGSYENLASFRKQEPVLNFRSSHNVCDSLKLILAMPEMCDVMFLVGPDEIPVYGLRAILGSRSSTFYQLIRKNQSHLNGEPKKKTKTKKAKATGKQTIGLSRSSHERLTIPVKKYDAEVFRMLVEFVHCGSVNISEETVVGLYCGACQFHLLDLSSACLDFVERCAVGGREDILLSSARCYSQHKGSQTLFDKIYSVLDRRYTDSFSKLTL